MNGTTIVIRTEPHPFRDNEPIYRAYRVIDGGRLYNLGMGEESQEALQQRVRESYQDAQFVTFGAF